MIVSSEVLRRRLADLLTETEKLTHPEQIIHMDPADRADALTQSWELRRKWKRFKDDLDEKAAYDNYDGSQWTDVSVQLSEMIDSVRRFDWLQIEFLVHSRRSVIDCIHSLRLIEEKRIASRNPKPDSAC